MDVLDPHLTACRFNWEAWNGTDIAGDAVLTVTGKNGASASYRARDIARGGLWSCPLPGHSLALSLSVSAAERPLTTLQVESFQTGYRSLGGSVPDNEYYRMLMKKAASV